MHFKEMELNLGPHCTVHDDTCRQERACLQSTLDQVCKFKGYNGIIMNIVNWS